MQKFFSDAAAFVAREKKRRLWIGMVLVLACAVVLATACALIRPATALDAPVTYCGKEEHVHTEACYTWELTCGQEESAGHTHTDACYEDQRVLVCGQEESAEHTHTDACYKTQKVLVCGQEESAGHTHTDACYSQVLTCGKEEHTHTDACYVDPNADSSASSDSEDKETDKTTAGENDEGSASSGSSSSSSASSSSSSTTQGDGTASSAPQNGTPAEDGDQPENAPTMMSNDIMTMAITTGEEYAIVDSGTQRAMKSPDQGTMRGQQLTADGDTFVAGENNPPTYWTLTQQSGGGYWISTGGRHLTVNNYGYGGTTFSLSRNGTTFNVEEQDDGTYRISYEDGYSYYTTTYYITYDASTNKFSVTTDVAKATAFSFVEENRITTETQEIEGLSPVGTVINLFDYSVESDVSSEHSQPFDLESGINSESFFKFLSSSNSTYGLANVWTGSPTNSATGIGGVRQGIVNTTLTDGYPVLSGTWTNRDDRSLDYLFDPDIPVKSADGSVSYKAAYSNVGGLLQIDDTGYYYYDSKQNYAEFQPDASKTSGNFKLYNTWAVSYNNNKDDGEFFPFDKFSSVSQTTSADNGSLNHYFGLTLTTRFVQNYSGYTDSQKKTKTTFEFSGDDDVWIFVDDVLVADLGGIHDAASVEINFADGTITIDKIWKSTSSADSQIVTYLDKIFKDAGKYGEESDWADASIAGHKTFADDTYHTLKFFYLERGGYASNMKVKYNLKAIPASSIVKVDQYGDPVPDAEFALYTAQKTQDGTYQYKLDGENVYTTLENTAYTIDENGVITINDGENARKQITPIYYGSTDSQGNMTFVDNDGMPLALSDLQERAGNSDKFILREVGIPEGYREVGDEVWMYLQNSILYCDNVYTSGAWAASNAMITATSTIYLNDQNAVENGQLTGNLNGYAKYDAATNKVSVEYYDPQQGSDSVKGTLFAVVLKYQGEPKNTDDLTKSESWVPVYGNDMEGYQLQTVGDGDGTVTRDDFIDAVIQTARIMNGNQEKYSQTVFTLASSGAMQVLLTDLPGDLKTYYNVLLRAYEGDAAGLNEYLAGSVKYAVAYYWTTGDLEDATVENTFRVDSEKNGSYDGFERTFGATIEVPNLQNAVYVQKYDSVSNELVDGATFAIYRVNADGTYQAGGSSVDLSSVEYSIDENGTITYNGQTIMPVQTVVTASIQDVTGLSKGTARFGDLDTGYYCIREVAAPTGYTVNQEEIRVAVTSSGVYADAGEANDGIKVARGPGYLASNLQKFAYGQLDNTLRWITASLKTSNSGNFDQFPTDDEPTVTWAESGSTSYLEYDPQGQGAVFNYKVREGATDSQLVQTTDVGWSCLEIKQDHTYGLDHLESGVQYDDLQNQDISNLFSQSVFVQVSDDRVSKLKISKTVVNDDGSTPDGDKGFEFTVNLYPAGYTGADPNEKPLEKAYPYTVYTEASTAGAADTIDRQDKITSGGTITLKHNQYVVIEELPHNAQYQITETQETNYTAQYRIEGNDSPTTASATEVQRLNGWQVEDQTTEVEFTNTYKVVVPADLTLLKVDSGNTSKILSGAAFVLYKEDSTGNKQYYSYVGNSTTWTSLAGNKTESDYQVETDDKGQIVFHGLTEGEYKLKETKAPDGYNLPDKEISLSVTADGEIVGPEGKVPGSGSTYTLTVKNSAGITLPETGGTGVIGYTCGGLLLMAAAAMYGFVLRRKREGRGK